jgi:hypothetical protein
MAWGKKLQPAYTASTLFAAVVALRKAFKIAKEGYRKTLRSTLQNAQILLVRLRSNEKLQRGFLKKLEAGSTAKRELNLEMELMTSITGDSRDGRKRASKYCKVLRILAEKGVPPEKTAKAIEARGGIAKIAGTTKPVPKVREVADRERDIDVQATRPPRQLANDKERLCGIYMRLSEYDRIRELPVGTTIKLDTLRLAQPNADLKLRRILDCPRSGWNVEDDEVDED